MAAVGMSRSALARANDRAFKAALAARGEVLVTVHGTNDGDLADEGSRWWQKGSDFLATLQGALEEAKAPATACLPFHWSGENSDQERLDAGAKLADILRRLENVGIPYHLLAHSHGGNVALAALARLSHAGFRPKRLRSVTSFGAPFLIRRPRALAMAFTGYRAFAAIAVIGIGAALLAGAAYAAATGAIATLIVGALVGAGSVLAGLLEWRAFLAHWRERARLRRWMAQQKSEELWKAVWCTRDEAIAILARAGHFAPAFITRSATRRSVGRFLILFAAVLAVLGASISYGAMSSTNLFRASDQIVNAILAGAWTVILAHLYFGLFLGAGMLLARAGPNVLLGWMANGLIIAGLRAGAFGEDSRYRIRGALPTPEGLPVAELRIDRADLGGVTPEAARDAAQSLYEKAIEFRPGEALFQDPGDLWQKLSKALYHTAYFQDAEVIWAAATHIAGRAGR